MEIENFKTTALALISVVSIDVINAAPVNETIQAGLQMVIGILTIVYLIKKIRRKN